jgi:hypothetical protein
MTDVYPGPTKGRLTENERFHLAFGYLMANDVPAQGMFSALYTMLDEIPTATQVEVALEAFHGAGTSVPREAFRLALTVLELPE